MNRPLAAAVLLAAVSCAAAPASASAAYRAFRSPSGKLGCAFYSDTETPPAVRCDWRGGGDHALTLAESGRANRVRVTDTVLDRKSKVLAYGRTTKFGRLRCTSREAGFTCRSTRSGHGFRVSVEKQEVF
jgi:hypothetical protein